MIKNVALKKLFKEKGYRIGKDALSKISKIIENYAKSKIEEVARNAKVSGRKNIKLDDIK